MARMRFGIFMAPFHPAGENPTVLLHNDLELIEHLDRLGFDEAWIGEHHSAGTEIIASPEIFIAAAAERTNRIKLGTGVVSASYHNPLWVAERAVQLDHMTRGRFMLGLGPGALPSDAEMIGLDMPQTRELLEDAVDVIVRLMRSDEPVSFENGRWSLRDARLHLRPYTHPHPEIAIAAVVSPLGPRLAGRYGLGLLSVGATTAAGFDVLALHWDVMEERAAHYGVSVDRDAWRLVGLMHLADTRAGVPRRRARHRRVVRLLPAHRRLPSDGRRRGHERPRVHRLRERVGTRHDRHSRRGGRADRATGQAVERWLRLVPAARTRLGTACREVAQLRAVRPPCRAGSRDRRRRPSTPRRGPGPAGPSSPRATSRRWRCRRRSTRPSATRPRRSAG